MVVLHINLLVMGNLVQRVKGMVVRIDLNFKPKGLCLVQEGLHLVQGVMGMVVLGILQVMGLYIVRGVKGMISLNLLAKGLNVV